jgi:hypothetical protein
MHVGKDTEPPTHLYMVLDDADAQRPTHPVSPPKIQIARAQTIASHGFLSWYTIYEGVSDCQASP